jgi:interferon gamma-inducible protein 30
MLFLSTSAVVGLASAADATPARRGAADLVSVASSSSDAPLAPIRIELYMETLCPYCANATVLAVAPIAQHAVLGAAVSLLYVPWGNARTALDGSVTCQHGAQECALNTLLSCAIALSPTDWFSFAGCLEEAVLAARDGKTQPPPDLSVRAVAARCAPPPSSAPAPAAAPRTAAPDRLVACAEGPLGSALTRMAAQRTAALAPPHAYVPWFVVNGVALRSAADDLLAFVCVALDPATRARAADVCSDPVVDDDDGDDEGESGAGGEGLAGRRGRRGWSARAVGGDDRGVRGEEEEEEEEEEEGALRPRAGAVVV